MSKLKSISSISRVRRAYIFSYSAVNDASILRSIEISLSFSFTFAEKNFSSFAVAARFVRRSPSQLTKCFSLKRVSIMQFISRPVGFLYSEFIRFTTSPHERNTSTHLSVLFCKRSYSVSSIMFDSGFAPRCPVSFSRTNGWFVKSSSSSEHSSSYSVFNSSPSFSSVLAVVLFDLSPSLPMFYELFLTL